MADFSDLSFFALLIREGSLVAASQQLGVTPPSVSKRLAALEARLGVRLLHRTTRRISLTPEGDLYLSEGSKVLAELEALERAVSGAKDEARGRLKIGASLGFGRRHIAPALSSFVLQHPEVEVQLHLSDRPVNLVEQAFDVAIRFGELPDAGLTAVKLAANRRLLCASPAYLKRAGEPQGARDLSRHRCIFLRESDETYGTWHLRSGARRETVKVSGPLTTNDGECALAWALDGHGVLLRSEWDLSPYLRSGRLRPVLPDWKLPPADVQLVFQTRAHQPAKTRALVAHLRDWFKAHRAPGGASVW